MADTIEKRGRLYGKVTTSVINGKRFEVEDGIDTEYDFLDTSISSMNLSRSSVFTVTEATKYRPDLISMKLFGTFHLGWLIARYNNMMDDRMEFTVGRTINIPNIDEYYRFINRNSRS